MTREHGNPRTRRIRAGNQGQRHVGRYLVVARVESRCEICEYLIAVGELVVRDDFGQWVHDGCCS